DECHRAHTCLACRPELWTVAIEAIGRNITKREGAARMETTHHIRRQLRLGFKDRLLGHVAPSSAARIGLTPPLLRQEKSFVDQRIALPGGIGGKHSHLTIVDLAQRATVLAGDPYRVLAFFHKPALVDDD